MQALRGHVDSINEIAWQPYSNNLASASSDKTVSVWDARTGLCSQTFYGHSNSVNSVSFSLQGDMLSSCDADGTVKLWDIRMVQELASAAVSVCFMRSTLTNVQQDRKQCCRFSRNIAKVTPKIIYFYYQKMCL